jgi:hypothetical protein
VAELRCLPCARRHLDAPPPQLGVAHLLWEEHGTSEVVVFVYRRRGKKELAGRQVVVGVNSDWDDGRMTVCRVVTSGEFSPASYQHAVNLHCRRCNRRPDVVLEDLRRPLLIGHPTIYIGSDGEVVVPTTRTGVRPTSPAVCP